MIPSLSLSMYYTCYNRNAFVISSMIFGPATSLFTSPDHDTVTPWPGTSTLDRQRGWRGWRPLALPLAMADLGLGGKPL